MIVLRTWLPTPEISRAFWMATVFFHLLSPCSFAVDQQVSKSGPPKYSDVVLPEYHGVEQLLLLSNRWVIVVTNNIEQVVGKIDDLSAGAYKQSLEQWNANQSKGMRPDWAAFKRISQIRDTYIADAREMTGERDYDNPAYFDVGSREDDKYAEGLSPTQATHVLVGLGGREIPGGPDIHYAHYSYLEMPIPLSDGKHYTITLKDGRKVDFLYDEMRSVSRAIKVNQIGYLPDAPNKYAYLGCYLYESGPMDFPDVKEFKIVSERTRQVVYSGTVKLRERISRCPPRPDEKADSTQKRPYLTGEDVYEMDFSDFTLEGDFFISIPGVGRSWPFRHAKDVYGEAFYTATRGLYHQRCGIAYEEPYTRWKRIKCHTEPVYENEYVPFGIGNFNAPKDYSRFDIIGGTTDMTRKTEGVYGGWHDAADWDRNIAHFTVILDLLSAYELAPGRFLDGQLNLPESGNGVPDILDEADWGLQVWTRSMDGNGGVSGAVETWTHPTIKSDPSYSFSRRTRWSSLLYAAAAAQLSQLMKPFDAARSEEYGRLALKAYSYGSNPENSLGKAAIRAARDRGQGQKYAFEWEEKDEPLIPYLLLARLRISMLTEDPKYLNNLEELTRNAPPPYKHPFTYRDYSPWFYFALAGNKLKALPEPEIAQLRQSFFLAPADELVELVDQMPYRCSWPRNKDYWMAWGSSVMTNPARCLWIAYALSGDDKYRRAAILNTDFMLGANPMGMSWTTGMGCVYPVNIQHEVSETDTIMDPVPGITVYGITDAISQVLRQNAWQSPKDAAREEFVAFSEPEVPLWRRWSSHPTMNTPQCEFTIQETMSSTIFCCSQLLGEAWMPTADLKERQPAKKEVLFGYWYLP